MFSATPFHHSVVKYLVTNRLPTLRLETEKQLDQCIRRLAELPSVVTSEPSSYVLDLVTSFCRTVEKNVHGDPESSDLVQADRKTYDRFKHAIRSSAPEFLPFANKTELPSVLSEYLNLDDNDDDAENTAPNPLDKQLPRYIFLQDIRKYIERYLSV